MTLNFYFKDIADKSVLFKNGEEGELTVETHNCIMGCYNSGMSKITEKNIDEWWRRYEATMAYNNTPAEFWGLTKEDIVRHIGLSTNVSQVSATKFNKAYGVK
jgi:hypothetical protein